MKYKRRGRRSIEQIKLRSNIDANKEIQGELRI